MKQVIICVSGGVPEVVEASPDVEVIIRDYDVGKESTHAKTDNDGDLYVETIYKKED